nr:sodium-dependent bicarbonate transport family permease [Bacillus sp. MRMR6]
MIKCFFPDAKTIEEFWHMVKIVAFRFKCDQDSNGMLSISIRAFKQLIRKLKSTNLVKQPIAFFYGIFTNKSDLKFPKGLSEALSIYLLVAIGLKGGIELSHHAGNELIQPVIGALFLGTFIPIMTIFVCRLIKLDIKNSVALGATYGSVSIVTFAAAISFLEMSQIKFESL